MTQGRLLFIIKIRLVGVTMSLKVLLLAP